MNFSDETVEKVALVKHKRECGHLKQAEQDAIWARDAEHLKADAQAALSSLTLADLMGVDEVRELVEAAQNVAGFCRNLDLLRPDEKRLSEALTPFTEAK